MKRHSLRFIWVCSLLSACTGVLDAPSGPGKGSDLSQENGATPNGSQDPAVGKTRAPLCAAQGSSDRPGPRLLRRLTKPELEATIRSVFQLDSSAWSGSTLPPDSAAQNGFTNQADQLSVGDSFAERLLETAESVGDAVSDPRRLPTLLPCASQGDEACATSYLDRIGKRLYRRPLETSERERYLSLFHQVKDGGGDFAKWVKWATVGLVSSPNAIYRSEIGQAKDGRYSLDAYERATALAYTFTGAPPDEQLLQAAEQGKLDDMAGLTSYARSLVLDDKGAVRESFRAQFERFANQWLGLSALDNRQKDTTLFPDWNDQVRASMRSEVQQFLEHVLLTQRGGIETLLTAPYTFVDQTLARFYGYGNATGSELVMAERPENWGVGLLAQGAILALKSTNRDTSPTQRGHFVQERILCFDVPPPPPTVGQIPTPTGKETTRERYEKIHEANPGCAGCHKKMDPIGFGLEHLDASGRYREQENGFPIDDTGLIAGSSSDEADVPFQGPQELATELANREAAGACFGAYFASFAFGLDRHDTSCLVERARTELGAGKLSALDFMLALVTAPHFTTRVDD